VRDVHAFEALRERLGAIADEALALLKEVAAETETFVLAEGVSKQRIDAEAEAIARSWGTI
jgi:hypothetical protein